MSDYYTVVCEYYATGEGLHRMIMIDYCYDEKAALGKFTVRFGKFYQPGAEVRKGIEVEGFQDLLTDFAKKQIVKIKAGDKNGPGAFVYENFTHVNYS